MRADFDDKMYAFLCGTRPVQTVNRVCHWTTRASTRKVRRNFDLGLQVTVGAVLGKEDGKHAINPWPKSPAETPVQAILENNRAIAMDN